MEIKKIDVFGIKLPLEKPFIISYDAYYDMPTIITRLETASGYVGWGETVPDQHVTGETWESTIQIIKNELAPLLIGEQPFNINKIHLLMDLKIKDVPSAKAALDIALYDLMGQITNQPLYRLLGGRAHESLDIPQVISILSPEEMAEEAKEIVEAGYNNVKIKVGEDPKVDIARIRAVRAVIPNRIKLRVDANQGWRLPEAISVIEQTKDCRVEWYEQPVRAGDHVGMAAIRRATHVNIMADESVQRPQDLLDIINYEAADLINIKLMKTGGIYRALTLAQLAEAVNIPCQIGSMVESAITTMAGAHVALSQTIIQSNEMVGPLMFTEDVAVTNYKNGKIEVSDRPGLGISVNENFIHERIIHHHVIE